MGTFAGIVGVVLLVLLTLATMGCSGMRAGGGKSEVTEPPVVLSAEEVEVLDREAIRALLKRAAETPPPKKLSSGAMCYSTMGPPQRADYLCPDCGGRTLYEDKLAGFVQGGIAACRREFDELEKVAGAAVSFNESQFCRDCSPDVQAPQLVLEITYRDGKQVTVSSLRADDIRLLREFLSGELVHKGERDSETAMKELVSRLEKMLGVPRR